MTTRRLFLSALCGLALAATAAARPAAAATEDDARAFVAAMADDAVHALTDDSVPRSERIGRFRALFNERFAVGAIGKWVLGRYWRQATDAEKGEYLRLFEDLIVVSYVDHFARFAGETMRIKRTAALGKQGATVYSEIMRSGGHAPISVNWRVGGRDGIYKVLDVVVQGTSMGTTLRSDFGSIIRRHGGTIDGLLEVLRTKTASLQEAASN